MNRFGLHRRLSPHTISNDSISIKSDEAVYSKRDFLPAKGSLAFIRNYIERIILSTVETNIQRCRDTITTAESNYLYLFDSSIERQTRSGAEIDGFYTPSCLISELEKLLSRQYDVQDSRECQPASSLVNREEKLQLLCLYLLWTNESVTYIKSSFHCKVQNKSRDEFVHSGMWSIYYETSPSTNPDSEQFQQSYVLDIRYLHFSDLIDEDTRAYNKVERLMAPTVRPPNKHDSSLLGVSNHMRDVLLKLDGRHFDCVEDSDHSNNSNVFRGLHLAHKHYTRMKTYTPSSTSINDHLKQGANPEQFAYMNYYQTCKISVTCTSEPLTLEGFCKYSLEQAYEFIQELHQDNTKKKTNDSQDEQRKVDYSYCQAHSIVFLQQPAPLILVLPEYTYTHDKSAYNYGNQVMS